VEPEPHGVAAVVVELLKDLIELVEVGRTRPDVAGEVDPGHVAATEPQVLVVEPDAIIRLRLRREQQT
jgi:hypothetical protein